MSVGPHSTRQAAIWEALETYVEREVDLDLNTPEQAEKFSEIVEAIDAALEKQTYEYALYMPLTNNYIQIENPIFGEVAVLEALLPMMLQSDPGSRIVRRPKLTWEDIT